MERALQVLLVFVPIAIVAHYAGLAPIPLFFISAIAIIPLAKYIGEATEELASRTSPALGSVLSSTFGNATELIIGFFALKAGLIEVVKASITGSIIGNLLLVSGLAMLAGGLRREKQIFNRTGILASGSSLFTVVVALTMPAILLFTAAGTSFASVEDMSVGVAFALLAMYAAGLVFSLRTHKHLYVEEVAALEPRWSTTRAVVTLLAATLAVAWVSEILVSSIEPLVALLGWSELFVGVIFLAIIGNAAENFSAVLVARKNRMDLSLQIAIGSASQIAMVVGPVLVLISIFIGQPMSLVFNPFELVSIVLSVLAVNAIIADGESNWLEGMQLLLAYVIIGIAFFFHP